MVSPILLLKTKSTPRDNYEEYFSQTHSNSADPYEPHFVPVLEHIYHQESLGIVRDLFLDGSLGGGGSSDDEEGKGKRGRKYGGLIFTSQRAVEGFARMLDEEVPLQISTSSSRSLKIYSVGPATSRSLDTLRDARLPHAEVIGHDCGTGEKLAARILEDYNNSKDVYNGEGNPDGEGEGKLPLLFLMGKLHSDIIPRTLSDENLPASQRIALRELVVYETGVMGSFEEEFSSLVKKFMIENNNNNNTIQEHEKREKKNKIWVVVFSPTGCDAMLRVLNTLLPTPSDGEEERRKRYHIATIGPTTRDHLISKYGVTPEVCAEIPSPEGVGEGIQAFMERKGSG